MKTRRARAIWFALFGAVTLLGLYVLALWCPTGIKRHRRFVEDSRITYAKPTNLREIFSGEALGWLRQQGTTASQRAAAGKEHEEALLQLGYFERRYYRYTNVDMTAFMQAVFSGPLRDRLCYFRFDIGVVEVTAHKSDFVRIAQLLREHEQAN